MTQSSQALVRGFVEECRSQQIILPGILVIERHCADALVAAERRIEARIAARLDVKMRAQLDNLLTEEVDGRISRFIWLRQFEAGKNSADINRQLDRLEFLQRIVLPPAILDDIPAHRVVQLRRQGERYFTDERTLFIIDWLLDADMQRRAQIGLNKGEAHHGLKNALHIGRPCEIRDRTTEGQHYSMAGLNLLAAIVIYWNTK